LFGKRVGQPRIAAPALAQSVLQRVAAPAPLADPARAVKPARQSVHLAWSDAHLLGNRRDLGTRALLQGGEELGLALSARRPAAGLLLRSARPGRFRAWATLVRRAIAVQARKSVSKAPGLSFYLSQSILDNPTNLSDYISHLAFSSVRGG
jgi:hypothetical protein